MPWRFSRGFSNGAGVTGFSQKPYANQRLNVLHLNSGRLFGGIERVLITLAACRGITPLVNSSFAVAAPGRFHQELLNTGALVNLLGDVRLRRPRSIVAARARLRALLLEQRCDLLICHSPWSYALFARVGRRAGVRVGLWQHDAATGRPVLERMCRNVTADLMICNSRWTAATAHRIQPRSPAHVVYYPVDLPRTDRSRPNKDSAGLRHERRRCGDSDREQDGGMERTWPSA